MKTVHLCITGKRLKRSFDRALKPGDKERFARPIGTTVVEIIVSLFLLATLAVVSGQIIASVVQTRLEQRKRAWAIQEAGNAMEKAFLLPWAELEPGKSKEVLSSESPQLLRKDFRTTLLTEATEDEHVRRLVVRVEWSTGGNQTVQQIQLVAFRHRPHPPAEIATAAQVTENKTRVSENGETQP